MHSYGERRREWVGTDGNTGLICTFHHKGECTGSSPLTKTEYVVGYQFLYSFIVGCLSRRSVIHCVVGKVIMLSSYFGFSFSLFIYH
jgi:hypothetical protein